MEPWFRAYGFPEPRPEVRFHPTRGWRFDWGWGEYKVALEVEGGKWGIGRHQRPGGFETDCFKYSWAAILGWCVVRATTDMVRNGEASVLIREALLSRGWKTLEREGAGA
jgi:hypothetical protein